MVNSLRISVRKIFNLGRKKLDRVQTALRSRQESTNDFFGGWNLDDVQLLQRFKPAKLPAAAKGEIVDFLGIRTDATMHDWFRLPMSGSAVIDCLPIPDDQVHAETIEYVALAVSIERARSLGLASFTAIELGASYSPWAVASGVLASRSGFNEITLFALEANKQIVPNIALHAMRNGLLGKPNIKVISKHGAIHTADQLVYFPKVNVTKDNGGQTSTAPSPKDYRGVELEYESVNGYTLATLSAECERIDFLHIDVQGAELGLLRSESFLDTLNEKVVTLFLATQSRLIEGVALENISALGWKLLRERPTTYLQNTRTTDVNGWTLRDGGQLWINPKFSDASC